MTVAALIEQYNTERPNNVDDVNKIAWLKEIEQLIINEIIITHENNPLDEGNMQLSVVGEKLIIKSGGTLNQHIDSFDMDTILLIPEPYINVYMFYLDQRIALNQNDTRRYNAAATSYNNALLVYQQYYNRTYKAITPKKRIYNHRNL